MGKGRSLKANNIYTRCRLEASKYDDRLATRECASEELNCSVSMLAEYELGIRAPQPDMILRMADRYKAPELVCHYCANECLLGKNRVVLPEFDDLDRVTIKLVNALKESNDIADIILDIANDGQITADEERKLNMINNALDNIVKAATALQLFVSKNAVIDSCINKNKAGIQKSCFE